MINSVQDYIESLKEIPGSGTSDYILLHLRGKFDVVESSKSLDKIFAGLKSESDVINFFDKATASKLTEFAKEGKGFTFLDPISIKNLHSEVETILVYSLLREYVSLILFSKSFISSSVEKPFNELLRYSKSVYFVFNLETKSVSYISAAVEHLLGYSSERVLDMSYQEIINLIYPDDRMIINKRISDIDLNKLEETPESIEFNLKDTEGVYHLMQVRATIEKRNGTKVLFCSASDVTEIRQTELTLMSTNKRLEKAENELISSNKELALLNERLEKHNMELEETYERLSISEEMFRQLAENTNDVFWLRNDKEFLYINNQFEKIWGRSKDEVIENPYLLLDYTHPEDRSRMEPWINFDKLIQGTPYIEQYRIIKPGGEVRWIWSRMFPVFNKESKPYRLVGIASDITEQKEFEEALRIAKEKAQESDMLKSNFLANISHEIRTPMNGIVGFAELLTREDIDAQTRANYVSIMKKSSEQLVCIIDDIIDFAKLESNQIRIINETLDLNRMLDELFIFYENQLSIKDIRTIELQYEKPLDGKNVKIISDENRLRQVLSYLLDNSVKYTQKGFIKFGYKLNHDKLEFYVQDSGIGIPSDKFEHIFERFRQVDEGQTRKYGGTGLGLPISKGLINLLGGEIWLNSELNKGSTFYFTIPYRVEYIEEKDKKSFAGEAAVYNWKDKIILVAEDDELNFEYIQILLEPTEVKLIRAKDGSQAVKICSNLNFDLILMDIRLPVVNGIQATKQLREMGISTPIIAQTAFAMDDDEQRCLSAGCNRYIAKPISKDKLYSLINELL